MKTQQLTVLFTSLKGSGRKVLFSDLLKSGYSSPIIKRAVEEAGVSYSVHTEGYTLISFD